MTVATKGGLTGAIRSTGTIARRGAGPAWGWKRLWQVPLLLAGLVAFGLGIRALVHSIRPAPFEKQLQGLQGLIAEEKYTDTINQINTIAPYYTAPQEQAELQKLAGDAIYLAQKQQDGPVPENYRQVMDHYQKAAAWGMAPTVEMNERWGECALALGEAKLAVEKLDAAIAGAGENSGIFERHARDLVSAYMDAGQPAGALAIVQRMLAGEKPLKAEDVAGIEQRSWALCKQIEIALGLGDASALEKAVARARGELPLPLNDPTGRVLAWLGRAELERGQDAAAERDLADARKLFAVHHIDDGRAAVLLGRILAAHDDQVGAAALFKEVVAGQAGTTIWAAARLGRADVAVHRDILGGKQLMEDYGFVLAALLETHVPVGRKPEMLSLPAFQASMLEAYTRAFAADKLDDALAFLAMLVQTEPHETADTYYRQAITRERRGRELLTQSEKQPPAEKAHSIAAGHAMLAAAADDYLKHADLTTLTDDISGNSKWKAAFLLDAAGDTDRAIAVFERFTIQRPHDARVSEGLLALGRLYESAGQIGKAVDAYQRNIKENPKTPASYTSIVNLARCDAKLAESAKPEESRALRVHAERLLLGLVQDNTDLQPTAREFRDSLMALSQLYYDSGQWGDAILRLDEVTARYPADPEIPRVTFMLGESYRRSSGDIAAALMSSPAIEHRAELEKARLDRLLTASTYFTRLIGQLDVQAASMSSAGTRTLTPLEDQYLRAGYMNRAECLFQRGDFEQAVKLYDETSARFSDEVLAVEAYVQIVNAYVRMNDFPKAAAAAERGQWTLLRVPDAALGGDPAATRAYYKKLLTIKQDPKARDSMTQTLFMNDLTSTGIVTSVVRALSGQKGLYEQILTLARQQTQLVATGQTEALMTVLGARSRLIEQVMPLDRELQPYKGRWQQVLDGLPAGDRKIVGGLLQDVQRLLGDILELDERDKESLVKQRTLVSSEIKRTVSGAALNRAYGRA